MSAAPISAAEADAIYGVTAVHERMPSGELRFRLRSNRGAAYILTCATTSGWQLSHHHLATNETYIVEEGWMVMAQAGSTFDAEPVISILERGEVVTTPFGLAHNVYLPAEAVIHTVKLGSDDGVADWHRDQDYDAVFAAHGADLIEARTRRG